MRILLSGASGFIGNTLAQTFLNAGHEVLPLIRHPRKAGGAIVDFAKTINASHWQPYLHGIDAVVNTVGLLGGSKNTMMAVHSHAPAALASAAARVGIKHFIHISALGVDNQKVRTPYFDARLDGEKAIRAAYPGSHILRPSLVFGRGGDSSQMFMRLTRFPFICLPAAGEVQPVHVGDICAAVLRLLEKPSQPLGLTIDAVGPAPLSLSNYIGSLARQLGRRPPKVLSLPPWIAASSARLLSVFPQQLWTPDTLAMLALGSKANAAAFQALLGYPPLAVEHFVEKSGLGRGRSTRVKGQ